MLKMLEERIEGTGTAWECDYEMVITVNSNNEMYARVCTWIVKDPATGEWVSGKSKESFIKFLNRDMINIHIRSKSKDLLNDIKE